MEQGKVKPTRTKPNYNNKIEHNVIDIGSQCIIKDKQTAITKHLRFEFIDK